MNTLKLTALSTIFAVSALVACSTPDDATGSSENAATADIDHMFKRPNGNFDVWCSNGTKEEDVTAEKINSNQVCGGGPATTSSSSSSTSGATSSSSSSSSSGATSSSSSTGGPSSSSSSSGAPAPAACLAATVPAAATWKKPPPAATVCTPAALQALATAAQAGGDAAALKAAVAASSADCATCIFTDESAAAWGPVIVKADGKIEVNWSACFARAQGGSDACGETFYKQNECALDSCSTCADQPSLVACYNQTAGDTTKCGQYDTNTACGGNFSAVNTACGDPFDVIIASCGGN